MSKRLLRIEDKLNRRIDHFGSNIHANNPYNIGLTILITSNIEGFLDNLYEATDILDLISRKVSRPFVASAPTSSEAI